LHFGSRVRALRLQRGLSLQALGDQLQLSKTHLCLFEQGKRVPSEAVVRRLARFFGEDEDAWVFAVKEAPRMERIRQRYPKLTQAFLMKAPKG
jgi:transcriptional regulator with XRE-family HTH domain